MFSGFMVTTWVVASIVAVVAGVVGLFAVVRDSTFAAHALPLGAFPGAAAAALAGWNPLIGLVLFGAVGAVGIDRLGRDGRREVATALTLVTLLGAGALLLSLTNEYASEVYALLFGQVFGIPQAEIPAVALMGAGVLAGAAALYRPLLFTSVAPDLAEAGGVSTRRIEWGFLALLAAATVLTVPVVGALLVFSLLVGPGAAARAFAKRPLSAALLSVGIALATTWLAVAISYFTNWPTGFFIGTLSAAAYAVGTGWSALQTGALRRGRPASAAESGTPK